MIRSGDSYSSLLASLSPILQGCGREPESFTHDCEFCQAGRSMLKALAGFHLKDSLSVHMSVGFSSVFQISLNSSSILLPCDGETCEPVNSTSDCLRNVFRRELSVNSSHKDAG